MMPWKNPSIDAPVAIFIGNLNIVIASINVTTNVVIDAYIPFILKMVKHNKNKMIGIAATILDNNTLLKGLILSTNIYTHFLYLN